MCSREASLQGMAMSLGCAQVQTRDDGNYLRRSLSRLITQATCNARHDEHVLRAGSKMHCRLSVVSAVGA